MKKLLSFVAICSFSIFVHLTKADATLITFDDVTTNVNTLSGNGVPKIAVINNYYSDLGVTFSCFGVCTYGPDVYAVDSIQSASSPNVISINPVGNMEPGIMDVRIGYIKATFSTLQEFVSIDTTTTFDGAPHFPNGGPFLEAFDSSGNLVGLTLSDFANCSVISTVPCGLAGVETLSIQDTIPDISYVLISAGTFTNTSNGLVISATASLPGAFDNLSFSVPEPSSISLFGFGIAGLYVITRNFFLQKKEN